MKEIIIALITGLCVAIPSLVATISSNKKNNVNTIKKISKTLLSLQK